MFSLFKQKCPICKMGLEKEKDYFEGYGKKFCSANCKEEYGKQLAKERSRPSGGCCH